jgi:hypothetical protein
MEAGHWWLVMLIVDHLADGGYYIWRVVEAAWFQAARRTPRS